MTRASLNVCFVLVAGAVFGTLLWGRLGPDIARAAPTDARAADSQVDSADLQARLAMVMADYHTANLWFAGKAENWPLADYYWMEVQSHMELSARADPSGRREAKLQQILKAIEDAPTMQVDEAISKRDLRAFGTAYRNLLVGCYNCHKAAGKPYLRPRMPVPPSSSIINVNPKAIWPR
jgi:hypothetical protein